MPLLIPAREDNSRTLQTYVRRNVPELDPTPERRSFVGALVKSLASALNDWYVSLKTYADKQPFPQTATGDFLLKGWWRTITKLDPIPAAPARGYVAFTGIAGSTIPAGASLQANGITYTTEHATAIVAQPVAIASLTYYAGRNVAVIETVGPHLVATGVSGTVAGASVADFNGAFPLTATGENELTYTPATVPGSTSATGATLTATWGVATVTAETMGRAGNISGGGSLLVTDGLTGVETTALVTFGGISGGTDAETQEPYRARILAAMGSDYGAFSEAEIRDIVMSVAGVTRVWIDRATLGGTNGVDEGQVRVAFLRDNDATPFPSAQETADVKAKLVALSMTANTAPEDVSVISPEPVYIDIGLSIVPDTVSMRAAVTAAVRQYFAESVDYGQPVLARVDIECAVKAAYDMKRRQKLQSFTLATPAGDTALGQTQMPFLGRIDFGV